MTLKEITGGSPYGASAIAGGMGERKPSANELELAKDLGQHLTRIAEKLSHWGLRAIYCQGALHLASNSLVHECRASFQY